MERQKVCECEKMYTALLRHKIHNARCELLEKTRRREDITNRIDNINLQNAKLPRYEIQHKNSSRATIVKLSQLTLHYKAQKMRSTSQN